VIFLLADNFLANYLSTGNIISNTGNTNTELVRSVIYATIWTSYFIYSHRVKETFTLIYQDKYSNIQNSSQNQDLEMGSNSETLV
jgi:hypothetical protein